jgi:tRNA pseudouridine38-40 synthase
VEEEPPYVLSKIVLGYDGSGFSGWSAQPGRRTVQQTLSEALGRVLRLPAPPALTVAGRTDAGVHAKGQVVHVELPTATDGARLIHRLTGVLPPDIRVFSVERAPDGFDARFSALWRRYSYRVCDDPALADPLDRHRTVWHFRPLDISAMNAAAESLLGEHDFAAFCKKRAGASTVRALQRLEWTKDPGGIAVAEVVADAFCHNMVRSLMGTLIPVGEGRQDTSWPAKVLAAGIRDPGVRVMPAHGLCLEEVGYPPDAELAARVSVTRAFRSASGCSG